MRKSPWTSVRGSGSAASRRARGTRARTWDAARRGGRGSRAAARAGPRPPARASRRPACGGRPRAPPRCRRAGPRAGHPLAGEDALGRSCRRPPPRPSSGRRATGPRGRRRPPAEPARRPWRRPRAAPPGRAARRPGALAVDLQDQLAARGGGEGERLARGAAAEPAEGRGQGLGEDLLQAAGDLRQAVAGPGGPVWGRTAGRLLPLSSIGAHAADSAKSRAASPDASV